MTDDEPDNALCVIDIENKDPRFLLDKETIKQRLTLLLSALDLAHCELSLGFVTPEEIKELNSSYRNKHKSTDVLSFPQHTFKQLPVPSEDHIKKSTPLTSSASTAHPPLILGDVIICSEIALEQAKKIGHSLDKEVQFLCIHGILHLCGYDHKQEKDEAIMLHYQRLMVELLHQHAGHLPVSIRLTEQ